MFVNQSSTSVLKLACQADSRGIDMVQNQSFNLALKGGIDMAQNSPFTPALKGETDFSLSEFKSGGGPFRGWGFFHSKNKQYG
ncbi:MAG: hypothetical protein AAGA02_07225 [Bacteroidota bacterium]